LAGWVRDDPGFTLTVPPSLALVCLRVVTGAGPDADDRATRALLEGVNAAGSEFLTHTVVDGRYSIRVAIGSVATEFPHVRALWERLQADAARYRQNFPVDGVDPAPPRSTHP
jgi:aromatic-L-amino-acid decarboxylase